MALVGYGSSDDEDEEPHVEQQSAPKPTDQKHSSSHATPIAAEAATQHSHHPEQPPASPQEKPSQGPPPEQAVIGPQIGPTAAAAPGFEYPPLEGAEEEVEEDVLGNGPGAGLNPALLSSSSSSPLPRAPGSPYTSTRATLRDLTLPTAPNMDIPPSPPGRSPPRATSAKFDKFLELKKQGAHFNSKITSSSALRNPALTDKLLGFVGIDHRAQYGNTLPRDVWDPAAFPRWSYKEQLRQSQSDVAASRARGRGAPVAFVTSGDATSQAAQESSSSDSQAKRKTRFDT